jgi:hypothetical protein
MATGLYAPDGSYRTTIANVDAGTVNLTVDTSDLASEATVATLATQTTLAALNTAMGSKTDAAWDGVAASASLIAIMKAVHAAVSA